jgi:HSP20 family protein
MATAVTRWDPFRDLLSLQNEMTRLFSRAAGTAGGEDVLGAGTWAPAMDVQEAPDRYAVTMELPGITPDQVDITFNDGVLTVRGERKFYEDQPEESFHRVERRYGSFLRSITLPSRIDADRIGARFENGLLTLEVPKAEDAKPRRIEVKASS